ncbi:histidine phosphatase family protein [Sphingobium vermicomposti]|uniref:Alpha-ribazole phosphatase n=1 Tax=Sphingobium vermicomposti TaxID=529005 RepID=A0A846M8B4_9SPHN|nr:histidine phosphatase family protein [Sphingobium vermicomposti]NIJ18079.1 alpha-ribazole phosphatase [Sphingobium vermicomposti]
MTSLSIHLMRHGVPEMAGRLLGHCDAPPDLDGMALCVDRARSLRFDHVVTSDLARARIPGETIATERNVALHIDPRWRELDFGQWDGFDPADLAADALSRFWDDPEANPPPDGERWSALCERVGAALSDISAPTLVLSHAGAMRAALSVLCGMDHRQVWAFDLPYGALLSLRLWPDGTAQITGLQS